MSKADNKIRIIDLLNKIANGEEVPKEIKVNGLDFIWKTLDDGAGYFNIEEGHWLEDCISLDSAEDLNTEVEILEDNTEEIEELDTDIHIDSFMDAELNFNKIAQEINKLGKAIRELRKEKE